MYEVWMAIGMRKNILEQMSNLLHEVYMRQERVLTGKYGTEALIIALREAEIKAEPIQVQMYEGNTAKKSQKDKDKKPH